MYAIRSYYVDKVEEVTGSRNVTLFGYCWGGILSLIYSAMHPKDVKNLILHATPIRNNFVQHTLYEVIRIMTVEGFMKFLKDLENEKDLFLPKSYS